MATDTRVSREALLPYSAQQMYDVVNDVAAYPEFLPWCIGAAVLESLPERITAQVDVEMGGLRQSFTTRNSLQVGAEIRLELVDGPFSRLQGRWRFRNLGDAGCKVSLELSFSFGSPLIASTFGKVFGIAANQMVDAFRTRAEALYGGRSGL